MRQVVLLLTIAMPFWMITSCGEPAADAERHADFEAALDSGKGELKALYVTSEGFAYRDAGDSLTGFTVELLRGLRDFVRSEYEMDLKITFKEVEDWSEFYRMIKEGEDGKIGLGNVTITEERREELAFSPPYMNNIASLISHASRPELHDFSEIPKLFYGMGALAFEGTLHEQRLRNIIDDYFPESWIEMAHSNDEIIDSVAAGDRWFAYIDLYNYQRAANRGLPLQRHPVADETGEQFGYIMPLNSTWETPVRAYFEQDEGLTNSAFYKDLMREHLGRELADVLLGS